MVCASTGRMLREAIAHWRARRSIAPPEWRSLRRQEESLLAQLEERALCRDSIVRGVQHAVKSLQVASTKQCSGRRVAARVAGEREGGTCLA